MKRIISVLITIAVLMGCAVTVVADSSIQVKKVNVFADVPYAGRVADFSARAGADAAENGYGVYYFNDFGDGSYSSVEWYDETAGCKLCRGDTFVKGHDYRLRIGVTASPGYEFAYGRSIADNGVSTYYSSFDEVTLNGESVAIRHFINKDYKKYLYVEREYPAVTDVPAGAIVDEVTVKNVDYPMAGNAPDFDVTTSGDGYGLHENSAYAVNWYAVKGEYLIELDRDDVFTAGTTYRVYVTLKSNYGWRFKYDNPETPNLKSVKINELSADYASNYAYERDVFDKELKISYTFGPCPGDMVSQIDITGVTAPAAGAVPSYDAAMLSDACVFSDYEDSKNKNGACWYDYTAGDFVRTTDTFVEGHEYSISFEIFVSDGYRFDKGNVTATVNGNAAEVRYYSEGDTKHYVEYRFAPCFGGEYIESVDITNVVHPKVGKYPVYNATVPEGCTITYVGWGLEDSEEMMNPAGTFENENTYSVIVKVAVADPDQYRFADSVAVTVNGKAAQYEILEIGELLVTYVFPPCGEAAMFSTPGDVNGDTKVTLADVSLMLKHIAKWSVELNLDAADVTGDGKVNLADVSLMLKYIARWDVVLK